MPAFLQHFSVPMKWPPSDSCASFMLFLSSSEVSKGVEHAGVDVQHL